MATFNLSLRDRKKIAENTFAFYFEKPGSFQFKAGQFVGLTLIDPAQTDEKGNRRNFTIASAPYEEDLMIATRIRDTAFKRNLKVMPINKEVKLQGPFGNLTLAAVGGPAVFLTGGIGITPFRSMSLQAAHEHLPNSLHLFYSNRRPEDAAFLKEMQNLEGLNPNYKFIATMTDMEKSANIWHGETGYINQNMLEKFLSDLTAPIYYIAGPPAMVAAMLQLLKKSGVDEQRIRTEEFSGY
ncbi:FAD-dependent oxidoreductase [bacterium]|nr:FAD-dependent oxidoreductase [bacterium]